MIRHLGNIIFMRYYNDQFIFIYFISVYFDKLLTRKCYFENCIETTEKTTLYYTAYNNIAGCFGNNQTVQGKNRSHARDLTSLQMTALRLYIREKYNCVMSNITRQLSRFILC